MARRAKQEPIDRRRSLASVPVLNQDVTVEDDGGETAAITVRVPRGNRFLDRFRPKVMTRRITLDPLGTFVVRQITGQATVRHIVDAFIARYKTNRREAELCIVEFLKSLTGRGAISIAVP